MSLETANTNMENVETVDNASTVSDVLIQQPKKRGRKPNPNKKVYFGKNEEEALHQTRILKKHSMIQCHSFSQK